MDSVIAVLPTHVIDQIAAGEVVERPASVVKELVDNALDAGARTISIETAAGGRALVRVTDDGSGMSARDAVLALERHATSKLRAIDDLWGIASMGFRGEALAAIASVARFVLTTRRPQDLAATRVVVEGGRLVSVGEAGAAAGTTVEVHDLLFNQPARQKFMKGEGTEASHVTELVAKLAMAHPAIHFKLRHNGRTALELPPDVDGFARAQALVGPRIAARLVAAHGEEGGLRVAAYLAAPDLAQTTARGVQLFVGKRPVRDRGLLHAVTMGYGELVARGRYPIAVVLLDAPAGAVDVNVHPQKQEVRFADPAGVAAAVRHVVQAGVASAPWRAESGLHPVQMIASVAPPSLPLDGRPATALSERYARDLRRSASFGRTTTYGRAPGQGSLFDAAEPDPRGPSPRGAAESPSAARTWAADIHAKSRAARAAERRFELRDTVDRGSPLVRRPFASDAELGDASPFASDADPEARGTSSYASDAALSGDASDAAVTVSRDASPFASDASPVARCGTYDDDAYSARDDDADACGAHARPRPGEERTHDHGDDADARAAHDHDARAPRDHRDRAGVRAPRSPRDPGDATPARLADGSGPLDAAQTTTGYFARLRYLGQLDLTYLVCETAGELVLVDQHAAHERVELARLLARHTGEVAVQRMLFPVTIEATPAQLALVERVATVLAEAGYEAEAFGKATIAIKAVPAGIRHGDPAQLLRRLLGEWERDGVPEDDERAVRLLAEIACHSVVRAGDRLDASEAEALLRSLDEVDPTTPAPHGKALLLRLPLAEIGRRFGR